MLAAPNKSALRSGLCLTRLPPAHRHHPGQAASEIMRPLFSPFHTRFIRPSPSQGRGRCHRQHLVLLPVSSLRRRRTSISTYDPFLVLYSSRIDPTESLSSTLYRSSSSTTGLSSDLSVLVSSFPLRHIQQWPRPPQLVPPPPLPRQKTSPPATSKAHSPPNAQKSKDANAVTGSHSATKKASTNGGPVSHPPSQNTTCSPSSHTCNRHRRTWQLAPRPSLPHPPPQAQ